MKKLVSRRILSVLLFCVVSTSVFGTAENDVRNDSLLLLSKPGGFDPSTHSGQRSLSQRCSELSDRSSFENTSPLTYKSTNGITSAHIALATVSVVLFFLNSSSLFLFAALLLLLLCNYNSVRNVGNALLTHFRGRENCFIFSFRQLKQTAKDIALFFILTLFFVFSGKEAAAIGAENSGLTPSGEKRQSTVLYTAETNAPVFAPSTSTVLQTAATITSTTTGGDWSNAATWKNGIVPGAGDDVIIADGATVTIDTDTPALGSLTIGLGTSGILQYDAIAERTVTVSGIVTINSGGTFRSAPPTTAGTIKDNLLVVGVSLINNGTIDFCTQSSGAGIKFIGTTTGNSMFNCEGSVKTNLQETNGVILEMDNPGKTLLFYPGTDFKVCSTTAKGFLTIVSGIFKLASNAIPFSNPVFSSASYTIPAAGGFELSNANATITGQDGTVTNQGKIIVSAGTYNIGTATGNSSLTSNDGTFTQSGGTINIAGRFKIGGGNCNISGGTMNIATIGYADAREAAFHIAKEANLNMVGAPLITFTYPHSNTVPFNDVYIESGRYKSIAGGTFQMGTSATPEVSTFFVYSEIPLDRITVFNECAIRVVNTSEGRMANTVKGTFGKVVLPFTAPEGITVICNGTVSAPYPNLQAFTDAGGKAMYNCTLVAASFKFAGQTQSGTNCPYTITRTYQVTDIFGSTGTAQQLIFVEDEAIAPPPEVVAEPAKEEVLTLKSATGILAVPTAEISGNATICGNGSVAPITITLTGTSPWTLTYQRDGANNVTVTDINVNPYSFNVSVAGTYTISAVSNFDGAGTFSGSAVVNVDQLPVITTQPIDQLDCEGAFVNFKVVATGPVVSYTWQRKKPTDADFTDIPVGASNVTYPTPNEIRLQNVGNADAPESTRYRVVLTNGSCSVTSASALLTVNEITDVIPSVSNPLKTNVIICNGSNFSYTVTTSIPANERSYQWKKWVNPGLWASIIDGGNISGATTNQLNFTSATPAESGEYKVTVTFDATGADCNVTSDTRTRKLTFLPELTAPEISGPQTICYNTAPAQLTATAATGGSGTTYSYQWQSSPDNLTWSNVGNNSLTFQPPVLTSSTYYRTIATDTGTYGCGTATSTSVLITVNPLPTATIAGTTEVCQNATTPNITFTGAAGTAPYTFTYTINSGSNQTVTTTSGNSVTVAAPTGTAGTFTYSLVSVQDASSTTCSQAQTGSAIITVNPLPTAAISGATAVCQNATAPNITFTGADGTAPYTFTYTINGGSNQTVTTTSGNSITVAAPTGTAGTFTYSLVSVQDASSTTCSQAQTGSAIITVNPLPTATIAGTTAVCLNATAPNITFTGTDGTAPYTFTYTINGGSNQTITTTSGSSVTVAAPTGTAGIFTYSLVSVQDASTTTCSQAQTGSAIITVNPLPTATIAGTTAVCLNATAPNITFTGAAGTTPYTFTYTINGGSNQTITTTSGNSITVAAPTGTAGTYTYSLVSVQDASSTTCSQIQAGTVTITVNPTPTLSGASQADAVCAGSAATINLTGLLANSTSTIAYSINSVAQTPVTGIAANGSGAASFNTVNLTAANNGQTLQITGITTTSLTPNCNQSFTENVTLVVNSAPVITSCPSPTIALNTSAGVCTAVGTYSVEASGQPVPTFTYAFTGATTGTGAGTGTGSTFNAGTTNVTVTATNSCGNVNCTFSVTVADNLAPVITGCPTDITVYTGIGSTTCDKLANWTAPTATDNCSATGSLVWTNTHSPGAIFPVGTTIVTYTVKDASNNTATCTFTITVVDNTPPTFTAPGSISINSTGACSFDASTGFTGLPSALADNCTLPVNPISYTDVQNDNIPPACKYPFTVTRTWKFTDSSGNITTHDQTITVRDVTPPQITSMPANKTVECNTNYDPVNPSDFPTATDCSAVTFTYVDNLTAGTCAGKATVIRRWRATDCSGNFTEANQTIEINDSQAPVVTFPAGLRLEEQVVCPADIPSDNDFISRVIASDNCGTVTVEFINVVYHGLGNKPGYCPEALTRYYRVRDNCNNSVIVEHFIDVLEECQCSYCVNTPFEYANLETTPVWYSMDRERGGKDSNCCPTADDNCISFFVYLGKDQVGFRFSIESGAIPSGSLYYKINCQGTGLPVGVGKCLAGDAWYTITFCKPGGNKNVYKIEAINGVTEVGELTTRVDCQSNLEVTGVIENTVTWTDLSGNGYERYLSPSTASLTPTFFVPEAEKDIVPPFIDFEVCGVLTGATDCGEAFEDCKTVRVTILPKIEINLTIETDKICEGHMPSITPIIDPPDNDYEFHWYNSLVEEILSVGSTFTPPAEGDYFVKVVKLDGILVCNESDLLPFTVAYDKTGPALIDPPPPLALNLNCSDTDKLQQVSDWLALFKATYSGSDGIPVTVVMTPTYESINDVSCGIIPVNFKAVDQCGNLLEITNAEIRIADTQAPVITSCPAAATGTADSNECFTISLNLGSATATDNCGNVTISNNLLTLFPSGEIPVGVHAITWTATDECNNSSTCNQTVTVTDNSQPPTITCPGPVVQTSGPNQCFLNNVVIPIPTYDDNCTVTKLTWSYQDPDGDPHSSPDTGINFVGGQTFETGVTTVTYTAYDAAGYNTACTFTVTIIPFNPPVFTAGCPANVGPVPVDAGLCLANVTVPAPNITDLCSVGYTVTNSFNGTGNASGNYPIGTTTVTWTITPTLGAVTTCTQTVTVVDTQDPTITCPDSFTKQTDPNELYATLVNIPIPTNIGDNCSYTLTWTLTGATTDVSTNYPPSPGFVPSPYPQLNLGDNIITYTIDDGHGNVVTCSFTIKIEGVPEINCPADISDTTDPNLCTATLNPGVPTLNLDSPPADSWKWVMTGATINPGLTNSGASPTPIGIYAFNPGVTYITWTAINVSGSSLPCTQTITVEDKEPPTFTLAATVVSYCVNNIFSAVYNPNPTPLIIPEYDDITTPRPEYYTITAVSKLLDLDATINNFNDNCCADVDLIIHWEIIFAPTPNPATVAHELITKPAILNQTGQPSAYGDIDFPGDGVTFLDVIHQINYWLEDCHGNPTINPNIQTVNIVIKPRPNVVKVP